MTKFQQNGKIALGRCYNVSESHYWHYLKRHLDYPGEDNFFKDSSRLNFASTANRLLIGRRDRELTRLQDCGSQSNNPPKMEFISVNFVDYYY